MKKFNTNPFGVTKEIMLKCRIALISSSAFCFMLQLLARVVFIFWLSIVEKRILKFGDYAIKIGYFTIYNRAKK